MREHVNNSCGMSNTNLRTPYSAKEMFFFNGQRNCQDKIKRLNR